MAVQPTAPAAPQFKRVIGLFALTMMNVATVASLRNLPINAEYGFAAVFWLLLGAVAFFIPLALVAAELASAFPHTGGVYLWVRAGLGPRWGLLTVWVQWLQNVSWYPTILTFLAGAASYCIDPELIHNKLYVVSCVLVVFWSVTLVSLRGVEATSLISQVGVIGGTFLPVLFMTGIVLAWWMSTGAPANPISWEAFLPSNISWHQLPLLAGLIVGFAGMEMPAVHARQVISPQKTFPRATLLSVIFVLLFSIFGTLAIVITTPYHELNLVAGVMKTFSSFLAAQGLSSWLPLAAAAIALGSLAGVANWLIGPCRALFASGRDGDLPPIFQKINRHGVPHALLIAQGIIVSLLCVAFVLLPDVASGFWLLVALSSQLYMVVYLLMFAAAFRLRLNRPQMGREFRIPGGLVGMGLVCGLGLLTSLFGFFVPFIPVASLSPEAFWHFEGLIIGGLVCFIAWPLALYQWRRPSWQPTNLHIFE